MDLTQEFPRSPKEKIAGLNHIPRMIDKARADQQNALGEYIYPCPMDKIMLEFLNVDSNTFQKKACGTTEKDLLDWITLQCQNRSCEDQETANLKILKTQPDSPEKWQTFHKIRDGVDPSRTDITTWADLIDLEEGRL